MESGDRWTMGNNAESAILLPAGQARPTRQFEGSLQIEALALVVIMADYPYGIARSVDGRFDVLCCAARFA